MSAMQAPMRATDSGLITLPAATALTLLLARVLPISFSFQPNELGIDSVTTLAQYPAQQEPFWFAYAIGTTALIAWAAQCGLRRRELSSRGRLGLEVTSVAILLATLALPPIGAWLAVVVLLLAAMLFVARANRAPNPSGTAREEALAGGVSSPIRRARLAFWIIVCLVLASVYSPDPYTQSGLWDGLAHLVHNTRDADLMVDSFAFKAERGQHLLWADALRNGDLPGRDLFLLYGPLYELAIVGTWALFGRSLASVAFFEGLLAFLGMASVLLLALRLVQHRFMVLLIPFLLPYPNFRMGIGFAALFCLIQANHRDKLAWHGGAGAIAGIALLFSQEYATAFLVVAGVYFALTGRARPVAVFAAGLLLAVLPVVSWLWSEGALGATLRDLIAYPAHVLVGYGNLPYPPLFSALPIEFAIPDNPEAIVLRLAYVPPLILAGGLLLALPLGELRPSTPIASLFHLRRLLLADPQRLAIVLVALYGILCFRSALGRSDVWHFVAALPPVALLLCIAADRCASLWAKGETRSRPQALWRSAALAFLVLQSGMPEAAAPLRQLRISASEFAGLIQAEPDTKGDPRAMALITWLRENTSPDDTLFFGPSNPAFHYLTERRNPTRFAKPYLMVTDAARAEALADLRAKPPRYIIWDERIWLYDDLPMQIVLGEDMLRWINGNYSPALSRGGFSIRHFRGKGDPPAPPAAFPPEP